MEILQNINYLWLAAGAALIVSEFGLLPGVGLFFAGLGALTTGLALELGLISVTVAQWLVFLGATVLWAAVLWKPLSQLRFSKDHKPFSDMIGRKAILLNELSPGGTGKAKWSGTIMNARLETHSKTAIPEGAEVIITHVEGNTLIVKQ